MFVINYHDNDKAHDFGEFVHLSMHWVQIIGAVH